VLRLHVDLELTDRTIVTCPPDEPPAVLAGLVSVRVSGHSIYTGIVRG
jgi:hypothetical protein